MTWNFPDCGEENSDENIWCPKCGQKRLCGFDGAPAEEAEHDLASGDTQTVIQ